MNTIKLYWCIDSPAILVWLVTMACKMFAKWRLGWLKVAILTDREKTVINKKYCMAKLEQWNCQLFIKLPSNGAPFTATQCAKSNGAKIAV